MPPVDFEITTKGFEMSKAVNALDLVTTVTLHESHYHILFSDRSESCKTSLYVH
jgi:hypothetical protein